MPFEIRRTQSAAGLPYALCEPGAPDGGARPLIVFLHGRGERGDSVASLGKLFVHCIPFLAERDMLPATVSGTAFPFAIGCPQTNLGRWLDEADRLVALVDELCDTAVADPARCYLTGVSLGGIGCWELAAAAPGRFAAIAPMSAPVSITAETETEPPAWVFHGEADDLVPPESARRPLAAHPDRPRTRATFEPGGHSGELWNRFYSMPELYDWLLEQRAQVSSG